MYKLEKLSYNFSDLEPFFDTHTLGLHYHKHYQTYLNKLLEKNNYDYKYSIIELTKYINDFKDNQIDILFNLGGVINHNIFFKSINDTYIPPLGNLLEKINKTFLNFDNFKRKFIENALSIKGSGYTFLCMDQDKNLRIINLLNQDIPYLYNLIPLFAVDMWEHAYYINYENKKDLYLNNFFSVASFDFANKIYNNL